MSGVIWDPIQQQWLPWSGSSSSTAGTPPNPCLTPPKKGLNRSRLKTQELDLDFEEFNDVWRLTDRPKPKDGCKWGQKRVWVPEADIEIAAKLYGIANKMQDMKRMLKRTLREWPWCGGEGQVDLRWNSAGKAFWFCDRCS